MRHIFTPEDEEKRKQAQILGRTRPFTPLCDTWLDESYWRAVAHARNLIMPSNTVRPTRALMSRWLHRLGFDWPWFYSFTGFTKPEAWIAANPGWSLKAFVGLLLEECNAGEVPAKEGAE